MAEYMTVAEAAELAGVTPGRIRQELTSGNIKADRFGKAWRIERGDLEAWLATTRKAGWPKGKPRKQPTDQELP